MAAEDRQIAPETQDEGAKKQDQSSEVFPEKWEPPLTEGECARLQELGLGIAVNITEKHSWGKKSVFQAKDVKKTEHLIVINESNQFKKYHEVVESYSEVQTALKSSFRPSPNMPIDVTIAADFHRSFTTKKSMKGETVLTRTVAFRMNDPVTRAAEKEVFELQLNAWLLKSNSIRKGGKKDKVPKEWKLDYKPKQSSGTGRASNDGKEESNDGKEESNDGKAESNDGKEESSDSKAECEEESFWYYHPETNHTCLEYLKALGGITHYVSSVTLGATRYQVESEKLLNLSLSQSAGGHVDRFASAKITSSRKKKQFVSNSKTEAIGRVPPFHEDGKTKKILPFRTKDEAVVRCSYTSLSNLVSHPHLQKELEAAIQEYIDSQLHGTRRPYYIATAEEQPPSRKGGARGRLYWKVNVKISKGGTPFETITHQITCTKDREEASNFYLKPFEEKYFFIATDCEDPRTANQLKPKTDDQPKPTASQSASGSEVSQSEMEDHSKATTALATSSSPDTSTPKQPVRYTRDTRAPQRFVCRKDDSQLSAEIVIDKKMAAFKLKNPYNTKLRQTLSKSQWLPEAAMGSQPYFVHLRGSSHRRHKSVLTLKRDPWKAGTDQEYTITCSPEESTFHQLFVLEPGHRT